jgi:hypothetical protein
MNHGFVLAGLGSCPDGSSTVPVEATTGPIRFLCKEYRGSDYRLITLLIELKFLV